MQQKREGKVNFKHENILTVSLNILYLFLYLSFQFFLMVAIGGLHARLYTRMKARELLILRRLLLMIFFYRDQ